ncbi:hypothetical protein GCM10010429_54170 [Micromonospora olivasterospora]|uniref:Uncharacterized protein n=1 Tax=Micromonospora olivasterospora TaxID=1880 RepID=A0A562IFN2_MICOL|nr:hypothetical protein JD77_04784 [Micromonospora olivasterospora]
MFDGRQVVARHPRLSRRYDYRDDLDHYLEILLVKPGAPAGSTALAQARAEGSFTAVHDAFWAAARTAHGEAEGTRDGVPGHHRAGLGGGCRPAGPGAPRRRARRPGASTVEAYVPHQVSDERTH